LNKDTYGVTEETRIRPDFFKGAEYRFIGRLADTLHRLMQPGAASYAASRNSRSETFREAHEWLMAESRKGRTIQRFKGFGEMNPDQLWETTVNPETRRLLQVTIEDAVAADQIFTTLMGDEVEPRREFIEQNALDVPTSTSEAKPVRAEVQPCRPQAVRFRRRRRSAAGMPSCVLRVAQACCSRCRDAQNVTRCQRVRLA
jgi:hypothetical protein